MLEIEIMQGNGTKIVTKKGNDTVQRKPNLDVYEDVGHKPKYIIRPDLRSRVTDPQNPKNEIEVCRIQALCDFGGIKAGDLGGWVQSEKNLSQVGPAWIKDNAIVIGDAVVYGCAVVEGQAQVMDNATVGGFAHISGDSVICDDAEINGKVTVDNSEVSGQAIIDGNARIEGNSIVSGHAQVTEFAFVTGASFVGENAAVGGKSRIADGSTIGGNAEIYGENIEHMETRQVEELFAKRNTWGER